MTHAIASRLEKEAFIAAAIVNEGDTCILWPWAKVDGYGVLKKEGNNKRVNRLVCAATHGTAPSPAHQAAHSCHVRACINAKHLRWATCKENLNDDPALNVGVKNPKHKLTEDQIRFIRASKLTRYKIAKIFNVSWTCIDNIVKNKHWTHLTNELK